MVQDCIFCRIAGGDLESDILYRDEHCFVIRDIEPKASVHMLVIPNKHFTYLQGLTSEHDSMLGSMFRVAWIMVEREGISESGYRLTVNQGDDAGQQVPHLHLHILGGNSLGSMA